MSQFDCFVELHLGSSVTKAVNYVCLRVDV